MYEELVKDLRCCSKYVGLWDCDGGDGCPEGVCADNLMSQAADAIEELEKKAARLSSTLVIPAEKAVTVEGYPVKELQAFAFACREAGVDERDMKAFANNIRFALDAVHRDMERVHQNQMKALSEKLHLTKEES